MAQNTAGMQNMRRVGNNVDNYPKRQRTSGSTDSSQSDSYLTVNPNQNGKEYATKEDFKECAKRISKMEERLARIEKTFENLRAAFVETNRQSKSAGTLNSSSGKRTHQPVQNSQVNLPLETQSLGGGTPSGANPAQGSPHSSAANLFHKTTFPIARSDPVVPSLTSGTPSSTPLSSSAQATLSSGPRSRPAQVTPSSASRPAQVTPSSASRPAQVTPSSASRPAQVTPSSASRPAQVTLSSASRPAQVTPSSASRPAQVTPSSAPISAQATPSSAPISAQATPSSAPRPAQALPYSIASSSKAPLYSSSSKNSAPGKDTPTSRNIDDEDITFIECQDRTTSARVQHSHNQQPFTMAGALSFGSDQNPLQYSSTRSSSFERGQSSMAHQAPNTSLAELWPSPSAMEIPEDAFHLICPKQQIYDDLEGSAIPTQMNQQLVVYIDGDCRKKKNHDMYAAVAGYLPAGGEIQCQAYVSDLKRLNPTNLVMNPSKAHRKMVELVKFQTEVLAAYIVFYNLNKTRQLGNGSIRIVARCKNLVQIMKNGFRTVYPNFGSCQCPKFPCEHPERWETLDYLTSHLSDDFPRLVLATDQFQNYIDWCIRGPEEDNIGKRFKAKFKDKISSLLKQNNARNSMT